MTLKVLEIIKHRSIMIISQQWSYRVKSPVKNQEGSLWCSTVVVWDIVLFIQFKQILDVIFQPQSYFFCKVVLS